MAGQVRGSTCLRCSFNITSWIERCPVCGVYLGAPNVRECTAPAEKTALKARAAQAAKEARKAGLTKELAGLLLAVKKRSAVVVSMPARIARQLVSDPRSLYLNYEDLVDEEIRIPALPEHDRQRRGVVGLLFGNYGPKLRYGCLSLTNEGVGTYGEIHCRMRNVAVDQRVTFLEMNSYLFVQKYSIQSGSPIPPGYRAVWDNRHLLVAAKLYTSLRAGQTDSEWQQLLLHSDGSNRGNDEFVEATIYGTFSMDAIEKMTMGDTTGLDDDALVDAKIAVRRFQDTKSAGHRS